MSTNAAVEILRQLVAFDTTSDRSNRALIDAVAERLDGRGISLEVLPSTHGDKAGLIASFGPQVPGGIVLSGHTDTVPVAGQTWRTDPYRLGEQDGRLYGRGTADMKGFIAAVLAIAPHVDAARLRRPLHLVLSYDEEIGCLAAPCLVSALLARVARPALVIVGEPTGMQIATTHRGISTFSTRVRGRAGHSGLARPGANAIVGAAALISFLDRLAAEWAAGDNAEAESTLNIGLINGGTAVNTVAPECSFDWECRPAPRSAADTVAATALRRFAEAEVLPRLRACAPEASIETTRHLSVPPLASQIDQHIEGLAYEFAGSGRRAEVPFASEAGFFQSAGLATVLCGPGDVADAHQANESLALAQLSSCVAFLQRLVSTLR